VRGEAEGTRVKAAALGVAVMTWSGGRRLEAPALGMAARAREAGRREAGGGKLPEAAMRRAMEMLEAAKRGSLVAAGQVWMTKVARILEVP